MLDELPADTHVLRYERHLYPLTSEPTISIRVLVTPGQNSWVLRQELGHALADLVCAIQDDIQNDVQNEENKR